MATKKISELEAITEADDSDVLAIVDVSEGKTNKITKNNLLIGAGHSIEMSLNQETYALTLTLKNAAGTELSTASIDLPNENAVTNISYNNGKLTLTKQSGTTTEVDISGLINGLVTESDFNTFVEELQETIQGINETIGAINVKNEQQDEAIENNYKVITKLQEDVEDLTERVEDAENNELTNTPTPATSHYLQDSADSRFRKFIPIGRTTQESNNNVLYLNEVTGGSNEIAPTLTNGVVHVKGNNNSDYSSKGFYQNGFVNLKNTQKWKSNTRYYISCKIEVISNPKGLSTSSFVAYIYGEKNTSLTYNSSLGRYVGVIDTSELTEKQANKTMLEIRLDGTEVNISEVSIKTEDNYTFTGYGNYPSPEMESPIKNTGDNGSVNEKVQNKNLFDKSILEQYKVDEDDEAYIFNNQTLFNKNLTPNVKFKEKTAYTIQYIAKQTTGNSRLSIVYTDGTVDDKPYVISTSYTLITLTSNENKTIDYISEVYGSGATKGFYIKKNSVQIEQGTTATSYVPHSEQNLSFPLAQGQKLYEGEELKENGKDDMWGEIVFTGIENYDWKKSTTYDGSYYFYPNDYGLDYKEYSEFKCSHAIYVKSESNYKIGKCLAQSSINLWLDDGTQLPTPTAFKAYLAEQYANGTPVTIVYKKANPTITPYTEEQQQYYDEHIKPLRTYKNVTHISSEDETPANVEVEYVQDTKTYIDNQIEPLKSAIISLGGNV